MSAARTRVRRRRTNSPCPATTSAAYGWLASIARSASPQTAKRFLVPRSSADKSATNESKLVKRNRLYIRP